MKRWRDDALRRELTRGSLRSLSARLVGAAAAFGLSVLVARALGPRDAGVWFLATTILAIGAVIGRLGLDEALLRFSAANLAVHDWSAIAGLHRLGMRLVIAGSAVVSLVTLAGAQWIGVSLFDKPELVGPLRWTAAAIVPLSLLTAYGELLKGVHRSVASQLIMGTFAPTLAVLAFGALLVGGWPVDASSAVAAYAVACAATALAGWALWRSGVPAGAPAASHFPLRELLGSSTPAYGVGLLNLLLAWSSTVFMGIWRSSAEVALFSLSARTAFLTNFLLIAVTGIVAPQFAALYRRGELDALRALARDSTLLMLSLSAPLLLLFTLAATPVMSLYGSDYRGAAPMLVILSIGQAVNAATGAVGYLLMMTGNERLQRNNHLATAIVTVALGAVLIPRFGGVGAAIATTVGMVTLNVTAAVIAYRRLGIAVWPPLPGRSMRSTPS